MDEIEKAHPDVFNILLQILDEGHITDAKGNLINFKNTIIIMTSNIGSQYLLQGNTKENQDLVMIDLKQRFKPELLNRIDEIVMFNSLDQSVVYQIIDKFIHQLNHRLLQQNISIELTDHAKKYIADNGFEQVFGARPLKRFIQKYIETSIAKEIIKGNIEPNSNIIIDYENGQLIFR